MSQSGIIHMLNPRAVTRRLHAVRPSVRIPPINASVMGPLLTLAAAILFDALARYGFSVPTPFPVMLLTVLYAAGTGGSGPAVVSAVLTTLYALHFFSERVGHLLYDVTGLAGLVVTAGSAWVIALAVPRFMRRDSAWGAAQMTSEEADAIRRRLSLLEQTSVVLASSLDYESTLGRVARLLVPSRADWCTVHLVSDHGAFRFVAGAHRDPGRDLVVRALAEHGAGRLPFGAPGQGADVYPVSDESLRAHADDAEHLQLYRALAPATAVRVAIPVRGETAGVLTLVIGESGREVGPDDVELAEEVAGRAALAIENAMLHREAADMERRFAVIFEAHPQPMWMFDAETLRFLSVNNAAVQQYGYSADEFRAMTIMDLLPRDDASLPIVPVERTDSRVGVAFTRHQRKDGTIVELELVSQELELDGRRARLVLASDVSERTRAMASLRQSEEQLRNAQRMDAVGRVGSGVAHDFNNVLTAIRGYGDLVVRELATDDPSRANVERMLQAADRGGLLIRQLLAFGGRQPLQPRPVSLNALVLGMEDLIRRLAGDDIEVETRLAEGLGNVHIDPARLEQAVVSLILAAREAMPSGGRMTIESSERYMGGFSTGRHHSPGQYAVLAISDTGAGLDTEPALRPSDRRTGEGLGLRVVSGIVRQSGGVVKVSSEPGEGSTVKILLPLMDESQPIFAAGVAPTGSETVLVVEDEDEIRELMKRMLSDSGYRVLEARHGVEGLLAASRHDGPIHLLVTDVVMPGMSGGELAQALRELRPGLVVLYISGYADNEVLSRGVSRVEESFLNKPFTVEELLHMVRGVLDKG